MTLSLVVQWLRIYHAMQEECVQSLVKELRSLMAQGKLSPHDAASEPAGSKAHAPQLENACTATKSHMLKQT